MASPWVGIGLVLAALGGLMGSLRVYQRFGSPHPELVRKLLHMGMGLTTLSFPWLFTEAWPVLLLAGLSIVGLLSVRVIGYLQDRLGSVLGGVKRVSLGEVYFPLAIALLFLLYQRGDVSDARLRTMLYCIPILLLTLADAAAALIGVGYGRVHYATSEGVKSAEGSLAFFLCAFFVVHIPLLLFTDTGREETLLIALLLAALATMFEAIAWRGLDNLVLPLVSFLLLKIYVAMPVHDLVMRLLVTAVMMIGLVMYGSRTTLAGSALLGALLVGYVSWALGGWHWLLPPLIVFFGYTMLSPPTEANSRRIHDVHAVLCVSSAGLIWLFLYRLLDRPEFLFPFTLAFAAHLAIIGIARLRYDYPQMSTVTLLGICILRGWLFLFLPYLLVEGITEQTIKCTFIALAGVALAALAFYWTQPGIDDCPTDTPRWFRQATHAAVGSAIGLVSLYVI